VGGRWRRVKKPSTGNLECISASDNDPVLDGSEDEMSSRAESDEGGGLFVNFGKVHLRVIADLHKRYFNFMPFGRVSVTKVFLISPGPPLPSSTRCFLVPSMRLAQSVAIDLRIMSLARTLLLAQPSRHQSSQSPTQIPTLNRQSVVQKAKERRKK
jgi:hypothetical protein